MSIKSATETFTAEITQAQISHQQITSSKQGNSAQAKQDPTLLKKQLLALLKMHDTTLVAHYYTDPEIQALCEESGGFIGDSLEMAKFGRDSSAKTLLVAGVRFMGETAKILSPNKTILMPTLEAECSLDLGCPADQFSTFCDQNPEYTVVVYANTSAAVKARADWVVTSSIAVPLIEHLHKQNQKILWAPDKYLGSYVQKQVGADMLLWDSACIVHEEFKAKGIIDLKNIHPEAGVLVHPESPMPVIEQADFVGSTTQLINAATMLPNPSFIVATDSGIFYKMQQLNPDKQFFKAPTAGEGATCRSCAHCPWMALNQLQTLEAALLSLEKYNKKPNTQDEINPHEITIKPSLIPKALAPLNRMLAFAQTL